MLFAEPPRTPYDLNFRLFGIPVQIHPGFWLASAIFGYNANDFKYTLVVMAIMLLSLLVHEFGHALMARRFMSRQFGEGPRISIYWMGGLCMSREQTRAQRFLVITGGPGAGILAAAATLLVCHFAFGLNGSELLGLLGLGDFGFVDKINIGYYPLIALFFFLQFNFYWSLINLLPVWSLDGGQLVATALTARSSVHGMIRTHQISMITAVAVALVTYRMGERFMPFFFAFFAFSNYMQYSQLRSSASSGWGGGGYGDRWR